MKLSFNIPTYNRAKYLAITLEKILSQIESLSLENDVEVNLSDNASTDNTRDVWDNAVSAHPKVRMTYKRNDKNLGPDLNFLSAMNMANGEYSLLWGDDDFLKNGGLKRIFELISIGEENDIQILLSSTSVIDSNGNLMYEKKFMREDINEMIVDFSEENQIRAYFFVLRDMGGLMSFITDVIYKTEIINHIPYHDEFTGTHYAFLNYWWGWLTKGKKIYCSNYSFIDASEQFQAAYGFGVKRELVDYRGFKLIADLFMKDKSYYYDFLNAFMNLHDIIYRQMLCIREHQLYHDLLIPSQKDFCVPDKELKAINNTSTIHYLVSNLIHKIIPDSIIMAAKKCKRR